MLTVLILVLLLGALRAARAVLQTLRQLPRSNDDFVFF